MMTIRQSIWGPWSYYQVKSLSGTYDNSNHQEITTHPDSNPPSAPSPGAPSPRSHHSYSGPLTVEKNGRLTSRFLAPSISSAFASDPYRAHSGIMSQWRDASSGTTQDNVDGLSPRHSNRPWQRRGCRAVWSEDTGRVAGRHRKLTTCHQVAHSKCRA